MAQKTEARQRNQHRSPACHVTVTDVGGLAVRRVKFRYERCGGEQLRGVAGPAEWIHGLRDAGVAGPGDAYAGLDRPHDKVRGVLPQEAGMGPAGLSAKPGIVRDVHQEIGPFTSILAPDAGVDRFVADHYTERARFDSHWRGITPPAKSRGAGALARYDQIENRDSLYHGHEVLLIVAPHPVARRVHEECRVEAVERA